MGIVRKEELVYVVVHLPFTCRVRGDSASGVQGAFSKEPEYFLVESLIIQVLTGANGWLKKRAAHAESLPKRIWTHSE